MYEHDPQEYYIRQRLMLGQDQDKFADATVAIIGVGGLGTVIANILTRMGVGTIHLYDNDLVSIHNLARQHLYDINDLHESKVVAAKKQLEKINPGVKIINHHLQLATPDDLEVVDLIIDGTDNHHARRIIDSFCKKNNMTWIHGAAIQNKGSVMVFTPETKYSDVYDDNAKDLHCEDLGILATTTSMVGTIQAHLTIDFLLGKEIPKEFIRVNMDPISIERFSASK